MKPRSQRFTLVCALSLPLLGCAPKEYASFHPDRAKWLEADADAAANAKEMKEPQIMPKTYYAAGQLFEQQGQIQKAVAQYRRAIDSQPDYVPAYNRLGVLLGRLGRHAEAEESLRKAVGMRPDWAFLRNNLGYEYMLQERWPDAEAELRNALRLKPDFARAHNNLGVVLAKLGRFDEALVEFKEAMPESDALYNLGLMYRNQNRYQEAAGAFERAVGLDPGFEDAKTQLALVAPGSATLAQAETAMAEEEMAMAQQEPAMMYEPAREMRKSQPGKRNVPAPAPQQAFSVAPTVVSHTPAAIIAEPAPAIKPAPAIERPAPAPLAAIQPTIAQPTIVEHADPSVLIVEAYDVDASAGTETDPCEETEVIVTDDAWVNSSPADDLVILLGYRDDAETDEPCIDDYSTEYDSEPIESYAELSGEENASAAEPMTPFHMGHHFINHIWQVFQAVTATVPAVADVEIIVGPVAAVEPVGSTETVNADDVAEGEALLCDFTTDGVELFQPTDWRELVTGFDASLSFLAIARSDLVMDEFASSGAISMLMGD